MPTACAPSWDVCRPMAGPCVVRVHRHRCPSAARARELVLHCLTGLQQPCPNLLASQHTLTVFSPFFGCVCRRCWVFGSPHQLIKPNPSPGVPPWAGVPGVPSSTPAAAAAAPRAPRHRHRKCPAAASLSCGRRLLAPRRGGARRDCARRLPPYWLPCSWAVAHLTGCRAGYAAFLHPPFSWLPSLLASPLA
jgi:hypothetical protein